MSSTFTTTFQIEKPEYKVLRFDVPLNANFDKIDSGLKNWPNGSAPGSPGNYDEIVLTEGVLWRDTTNHILKVYTGSAWSELMGSLKANMMTQVTAPVAALDKCFIYGYDQAAGNCCFHTMTEGGKIIKLFQQAHIADVNNTTINSDDNSTTNINNIKAVVDDLRTKMNQMFQYKENLGLHAAS